MAYNQIPKMSGGLRRHNIKVATAIIKADSLKPVTCPEPIIPLTSFLRDGWSAVEGGTKLDWNWHIDSMCWHVETVLKDWAYKQYDENYEQRVQNLLINVPPGCLKSRIVSVMVPAWMWTWFPAWRSIFLSSNPRVAIRDSVYCREVIKSDWYQRTFRPSWSISRKTDSKQVFKNSAGGFRQAMGIMSKITGDRGDALFVDDPHDAQEVMKSDILRKMVLERWDLAISNRVNDLRTSVRIGIMQRLHEEDWSGHVLKKSAQADSVEEKPEDVGKPVEEGPKDWCVCVIRQEYEPGDPPNTLGWQDPRMEPGELMFPLRFPRKYLAEERARLGAYGYAGQHQQNPVPLTGGMFGDIPIMASLPNGCYFVRYWDKAGTEGDGAYSAGVKMAVTPRGEYVVCDIIRGQWSAGKREEMIRKAAENDGKETTIWFEQEPGSGGKESAENSIKALAGWIAKRETVTGDKVTRAKPFAVQTEITNVYMLPGHWNASFVEELRLFPNSRLKDQVDAASGAFNKLALMPRPGGAFSIPGKPSPSAPAAQVRMTAGLPDTVKRNR